MASNRVTVEQFESMTPEDATGIPSDQLLTLQDEIKQRVAAAKALNDKLQTTLLNLYADSTDAARTAQKKTSGIVHIPAPDDPDVVVTGDKKINVEWNQDELWKVAKLIQEEWGGKPGEYIITKLSVSETAYKSWPTPIRKEFEAARTTKPGGNTIKLERKKEKGA
jgi:hypothetical protein